MNKAQMVFILEHGYGNKSNLDKLNSLLATGWRVVTMAPMGIAATGTSPDLRIHYLAGTGAIKGRCMG